MTEAAVAAVAMFMAGVIYQLGRFAARLEHIEAWKNTVEKNFDQVFAMLRDIKHAIDIAGRE